MSEEIKAFRKTLEMTQQQFATKLKVAIGTVYRWEAGTVDPSPLALEELKRLGFQAKD